MPTRYGPPKVGRPTTSGPSGAWSASSGGTRTISRYDWCPGWGPQDSPADLAYPGDDVVDYIGLDVYDFKHEGSVEERWNTFYLKAPFGLEWHRDFAARHGKPMSYPEWGVGNFGDNPYFIQQMHDWFVREPAEHRLCRLFRCGRAMADANRQQQVSEVPEAVPKTVRTLMFRPMAAIQLRLTHPVNRRENSAPQGASLDRILQQCSLCLDSRIHVHRCR